MSTPTLATLGIAQTGPSNVAMVSQTWTVGGTPITVFIQASTIVDSASQNFATVDANGLHVVPSIGAPNSGLASNTTITGNSPVTLVSSVSVTNGKTGTLQHAVFSATSPMLWQLQTVNNSGSATTVLEFITDTNDAYDYRSAMNNAISTVLSNGSAKFQVVATNLSGNQVLNVQAFANFFWAEN